MKNWVYQNKRNPRKYIDLKRYDSGHFYWRQRLEYPNGITHYVGSKKGTFSRICRATFTEVLTDYICVDSWNIDAQ